MSEMGILQQFRSREVRGAIFRILLALAERRRSVVIARSNWQWQKTTRISPHPRYVSQEKGREPGLLPIGPRAGLLMNNRFGMKHIVLVWKT
jgi:hypothetical protein